MNYDTQINEAIQNAIRILEQAFADAPAFADPNGNIARSTTIATSDAVKAALEPLHQIRCRMLNGEIKVSSDEWWPLFNRASDVYDHFAGVRSGWIDYDINYLMKAR